MRKDKGLWIVAVGVLLLVFGSYGYAGNVVVTNGLVSWWKLDEGSGTAAGDCQGNNNGTLNGGYVWTAYGYINGAVVLDGTNGYIAIGDQPSIKTTNVTVEAWVKIYNTNASPNNVQGIIDSSGSGSWGGYVLIYNETANRWEAHIYDGDTNTYQSSANKLVQSTSGASTGVWTHLVLTCDGTAAKMYVNGVWESTVSVSNLTYAAVGSNVEIGQFYSNLRNFSGLIDEVRIYNRALSAKNVMDNYLYAPRPNSGSVVTNNLVSWWKLDEGTGAAAGDCWGNNNGTLNGGAVWTTYGYIYGAVVFDGTNGYIAIGDQPSIKTTNVTVEAWVKIYNTNASPNNVQGIIDSSGSGSWGGYVLKYNETANRWEAAVYFGDTNSYQSSASKSLQSNGGASPGIWTHLVLTCDGTSAKMYVNAVLQTNTVSVSNLTYAAVGSNVEIGQYYSNFRNFSGIIDEFRVYDKALSNEEIRNNYLVGFPKGIVFSFH